VSWGEPQLHWTGDYRHPELRGGTRPTALDAPQTRKMVRVGPGGLCGVAAVASPLLRGIARPALYLAVMGPQEAESAIVVKTTSGGSAGFSGTSPRVLDMRQEKGPQSPPWPGA
jgi:hypothetical protein